MLRPPGIIDAAKAMAASLSRRLEIKYRATSDKQMSETPKSATKGRNASHVETGISCNAFQAVQRASIVPQFPFGARAAPARKNTTAVVVMPTSPTAIAPAARNPCGIRSQATAAQSANALHMLIE